jgi:hypothetical protein
MKGVDDVDVRLIAQGHDWEALVSEFRVAAGERVVAAEGELSFIEGRLKDTSILPTGRQTC